LITGFHQSPEFPITKQLSITNVTKSNPPYPGFIIYSIII
jgi:hypothetical protein